MLSVSVQHACVHLYNLLVAIKYERAYRFTGNHTNTSVFLKVYEDTYW